MNTVHIHKAHAAKANHFALLIPGLVFTIVVLTYLLIKEKLPDNMDYSATTGEIENIDR